MILCHSQTDAPVTKGDAVTNFRGRKATVTGWREPQNSSSTGRIYVRFTSKGPEEEYYPSVFGCYFRDSQK